MLATGLEAQGKTVKTLSLEEAIKIATENNLSLKLSGIEVDLSKNRVRKAKSHFYPQIESKLVLPFLERESGISVEQLVWDFNRTSNYVKTARSELKAAEYLNSRVLNDTIRNTTILYYKALINKSRLEAAEKNLEKNNTTLEKIRVQNKLRRVSDLDLTRAISDAGNARLNLLSKQNQYEVSKMNLLNSIGADFDTDIELAEQEHFEFSNYDLNSSLKKAIQNSLELKRLNAEHSAKLNETKASKGKFYPQIFGRAAFRFEGKGGDDEPSLVAGLGLRFPIFTGFARLARLNISKAETTRALIQIEKAKKKIESEIKKLFMDLKFGREKIDLTRINNNIALDNLNLVREKSRLGRASGIDLAEAEFLYSQSRSDYIEAIYDHKITKAKFSSLIGEH